ncbi:MAG: hypothetical protein M1835_001276, partial [Candelina submexicana]
MGERELDHPKQPQFPRLAKVRLGKVRRHRKMKLDTNILLTCKQICDEGSFILYQRNTFFFDSVTAMEKWLVPITARWEGKHPSRYRHNIRKVEIAVGIVREPQELTRIVGGRALPQRLYVEELSDDQQLLFQHL